MDEKEIDGIGLEIDSLFEHGIISDLDYYFARSLARVFPMDPNLAIVSGALASRALSRGHVFLDIKQLAQTRIHAPLKDGTGAGPGKGARLPSLEDWISALEKAEMVASPVHGRGPQQDGRPARPGLPMVLDETGCLFLSKYYDFQSRLAKNICQRFGTDVSPMDGDFVQKGIKEAFKGQDPVHTACQKEAVKKALTRNLTLISGGPGTGKTHITNIIRDILRAFSRQKGGDPPRILSLAPTGKAASRLRDGLTIHSALKPLKNGPGFFHNKSTPLGADMVIIDEASMIDLALMTRLMEAIPLHARVILLGDANQLSPVQAGAVFAELCQTQGLESSLVFLAHNFRSGGKSGLERLARAVREKDVHGVKKVLETKNLPDIKFVDTNKEGFSDRILEQSIIDGYDRFLSKDSLFSSLGELDGFRILCAHNLGPWGTLSVNSLCEKLLQNRADSDIKGKFFKRIIMVRLNDYNKGLFNGDTGVVFPEASRKQAVEDRGQTVGFKAADKGVRTCRYADLPGHETAFAVTIHKSQGSEFEQVLIIIPDQLTPVVTRQLLYTGVTRARKKVTILGAMAVIEGAMAISPEQTTRIGRHLKGLLDRKPV